jgi:hypothetical protein
MTLGICEELPELTVNFSQSVGSNKPLVRRSGKKKTKITAKLERVRRLL